MARTRTKRMVVEENQNKTILESVKTLRPEDVITEIGNLQVGLQSTLAGVSATITSKIEQMQNIDSAISLKKQELQEVYAIEKEAMSLEDIREAKAEEQIEWDKAREMRHKQWDEEEKEREKKWARVEEQRQYEVNKAHRERLETLEVEFRKTRRDEQLRQEDLKRQWMERENALKTQEDAVIKLQEDVAQFDTKLKEAVAKAEATATNAVKRNYEHQMQLILKDHEAEKKVYDSKVLSLEHTIKTLSTQVHELQAELRAAREDAKEVTSKALESASQRQAATAFQKAVESGGLSTTKK